MTEGINAYIGNLHLVNAWNSSVSLTIDINTKEMTVWRDQTSTGSGIDQVVLETNRECKNKLLSSIKD